MKELNEEAVRELIERAKKEPDYQENWYLRGISDALIWAIGDGEKPIWVSMPQK